MADARLAWLSATELAALIRKKTVSPVEVVGAVLARIEAVNPRLNAFVTLTEESARREAKVAERALMKRGARLGPLHGVPFSVKDLVITRGVRTTFGTPLYRDNVPTEDAPIVERMKGAGGVMRRSLRPQALVRPNPDVSGERRVEPVAHRPADPHGGGRGVDADRLRRPRRARPVLAARPAPGLREGATRQPQGPPRRVHGR